MIFNNSIYFTPHNSYSAETHTSAPTFQKSSNQPLISTPSMTIRNDSIFLIIHKWHVLIHYFWNYWKNKKMLNTKLWITGEQEAPRVPLDELSVKSLIDSIFTRAMAFQWPTLIISSRCSKVCASNIGVSEALSEEAVTECVDIWRRERRCWCLVLGNSLALISDEYLSL